jgi:hypothetical protein
MMQPLKRFLHYTEKTLQTAKAERHGHLTKPFGPRKG